MDQFTPSPHQQAPETVVIFDKDGNEGHLFAHDDVVLVRFGDTHYLVTETVQAGGRLSQSFASLEPYQYVVPVVEETLQVGKRTTTGKVRIEKHVTEVPENVKVDLRSQTVRVERKPIGQVVTEVPKQRQEGNTVIVPVLEERLVITRELFLKEELHIIQTQDHETVEETVMLRKEHVSVDREENQ